MHSQNICGSFLINDWFENQSGWYLHRSENIKGISYLKQKLIFELIKKRNFSSNQKVQIKETEIASYGFLFPPKPYCVPARCCALLSSQIIVFPFSFVLKEAKSLFSSSLRSYLCSIFIPKRLPVRSKTRQMAAIKGFHKTKLISVLNPLFWPSQLHCC